MLAAITPQNQSGLCRQSEQSHRHARLAQEELVHFINNVPAHVLVAAWIEAYIEFLDDPLDLLPLIRGGNRPNLLLMRTFSKIYGLAGLRLGYGIAHPELVIALEKIRQPFNINLLAQAAGLAALDDTEHVRKTRQTNASGLKFFEDALRKMKIEFVPSAGNFILVRVGNGQSVFDQMQRHGVITRPMGGYKLPEWIRISVGTARTNGVLQP